MLASKLKHLVLTLVCLLPLSVHFNSLYYTFPLHTSTYGNKISFLKNREILSPAEPSALMPDTR